MSIIMHAMTLIPIVAFIVAVGASAGRIEYNKLLTECQRELPRNQHCELVAVPRVESEIEQ